MVIAGTALSVDCVTSKFTHMPPNRCVLQTYTKEDRLIITQLPFSSTLVDFWALVWDYTCTAVVVLNQLQELDKVSCPPLSLQPAFCLRPPMQLSLPGSCLPWG